MSTFVKMAGVLMIIGAVCSGLLAAVNDITFERRDNAAKMEKLNALKTVLPEFDNNPSEEMKEVEGLEVYTARKGGEVAGYAVESFDMGGYEGEIRVMVGVNPDLTVNRIKIVAHKETPGLGNKAEKPKWNGQLEGKKADELKVTKDGGTIDSISGATITSRAVCNAAKKALQTVEKNISQLK